LNRPEEAQAPDLGIIFASLQHRLLIVRSRALVHKHPSSPEANFRAGQLHINTIYVSGDVSRLPERAVAFALLHEEGHLAEKQHSTWFKVLLVVVVGSVIANDLWHVISRVPTSQLELIAYVVAAIFLTFSPRICRRWLVEDEVWADVHATAGMLKAYPEINSEEIVDAAKAVFEAVGGKKRNRVVKKVFFEWFGWDVHPKNQERIATILKALELVD